MITGDLNESTTKYDAAFREVRGLTWLPWAGRDFPDRPPHQRLLVVGESHYYNGKTPEEREANREKWLKYPNYTRECVSEQLVNHEWENGNKTFDTLPKLLFKTFDIDHPRLWGDSAYYNIVQRMMDYGQDGNPERPTWNDYTAGWGIFAEVARIIQPSHCLFIGVEAANFFTLGTVSRTQRVGRTWARTAKAEIAGTTIQLIFVQHLGKYFSWSQWHDYLQALHPDLMRWLGSEAYAQKHTLVR